MENKFIVVVTDLLWGYGEHMFLYYSTENEIYMLVDDDLTTLCDFYDTEEDAVKAVSTAQADGCFSGSTYRVSIAETNYEDGMDPLYFEYRITRHVTLA